MKSRRQAILPARPQRKGRADAPEEEKAANQPQSQRISEVKEMFSQTRDHAKRAKSKGMNWAPCSALAR
jgi:hypothetical protein